MDALINAMGTPEDHDRRMAAWRDAERDAMARALGRGRGGDEETVSNAADDAVDGGTGVEVGRTPPRIRVVGR